MIPLDTGRSTAAIGDAANSRPLRRPLFQKYFLAFFVAVVIPLSINGAIDAWFGYREYRATLDERLRVEARAAAGRIRDFLDGITAQMDWTVELPWSQANFQRHRLSALRLLRQVPAIVELTLIDGAGKERLKISRLGRDIVGSGVDRSADPAVGGAQKSRLWFGPVTLNRGSEPYMTVAVAGNRAEVGISVAVINLKLIWDVITAIRVGRRGGAFVTDRDGKLIAHPNISLVLQGADAKMAARLNALRAAVAAAGGAAVVTEDPERRSVLVAMAPVVGVDWQVFAALPLSEAFAPIRAALWRTGTFLLAGAVFAALLALLLARRMTVPIRTVEQGVARIGAGNFSYRIEIETGDEIERLSASINDMAGELALSRERSDRIARLRRFLSPQVAELVEKTGESDLLAAHHAVVVVVFCDLRGFTAFSTKSEPQDIMRVLGAYYDVLGAIITSYEATLTHFSGDELMVLLNAPVPCPDNPALRGIRMASDMQRAVQVLIAEWRQGGAALGFGVGLAMGEATVGRIGYEGRSDYTAIGTVTNLAARLCAEAMDGQILIDGNAAAEAGDIIPLVPAGKRMLKGFEGATAAYEIAPTAPIVDATPRGVV